MDLFNCPLSSLYTYILSLYIPHKQLICDSPSTPYPSDRTQWVHNSNQLHAGAIEIYSKPCPFGLHKFRPIERRVICVSSSLPEIHHSHVRNEKGRERICRFSSSHHFDSMQWSTSTNTMRWWLSAWDNRVNYAATINCVSMRIFGPPLGPRESTCGGGFDRTSSAFVYIWRQVILVKDARVFAVPISLMAYHIDLSF